MRTRTLVVAALAAALALPAAAAAKGPSSASLSGPGITGAIPITGEGEGGTGTPLGDLVSTGGYFPQVFGQSPDPTLRSRPKGDLGPGYRITYVVPAGGSTPQRIVQLVYPYAKPAPVTYMRPGQLVWEGQATIGGWFTAPVGLKASLVQAGLPATPPSTGGDGFWSSHGTLVSVAAVALLGLVLVLGGAMALRRRERPVVAH